MLEFLIPAAASLASGLLGRSQQQSMFDQNAQLQREFAQNGVIWKAQQAEQAGVSKLFALGAPTTSFSPISVGGDPLASSVSSMGQDIGRAVHATSDASKRQTAMVEANHVAQLVKTQAEVDYIRSRTAAITQTAAPALPALVNAPGSSANLPGQGSADQLVKVSPGKTEALAPGNPSQAAVIAPDMAFSRTRTGYSPVPSATIKEQIEDITIPQLMWGIRNNILPIAGINQNPPQADPGKDNVWVFHPGLGEYQAHPRSSWWAKAFGRKSDVWR